MNNVLKIEDLVYRFRNNTVGEIVKTQTTYIDIICSFQQEDFRTQNKFRIHFLNKQEFSLSKGEFNSLQLLDKHPLLLEYIEPFVVVQLTSPVLNKKAFYENFEFTNNQIFNGWRSINHYLFMPLEKFIEKDYGILMEAPKSFAEVIVKMAKRHNVKLTMREKYQREGEPPKLLILDKWYVVADNFTVNFEVEK